MAHGTPYKPLIDSAILHLQEGGVLHKLRVKWWKQKRGLSIYIFRVYLIISSTFILVLWFSDYFFDFFSSCLLTNFSVGVFHLC